MNGTMRSGNRSSEYSGALNCRTFFVQPKHRLRVFVHWRWRGRRRLILAHFTEFTNQDRIVVYRKFAAEALESAKVTGSDTDAALYLNIAEQWIKLVELVEARRGQHTVD
jgi:hypothetical protein